MDTSRSTLSGTVVVIEDKNVKMVPFIIFELLYVTFVVIIYIILPTKLLSLNLGLILNVFFFILFALILGLTLSVANIRGFIEITMTYVLFFWERKSMIILIEKNLIAHKHTNKLTSIIYALTLGCIIFLCVALNLVIMSTETGDSNNGADIKVIGTIAPSLVDPLLLDSYSRDIKDVTYVTSSLW